MIAEEIEDQVNLGPGIIKKDYRLEITANKKLMG
jgi:hypothetical protein